MAYLTLDGVAVPCDTRASGEDDPETVGQDVRTFAGGLRSTERINKRQWTVTTPALSEAAAATIIAECGTGVVCNGFFNNNVAVTCTVRRKGGRHGKATTTTRTRVLVLVLREE